MYRSSTGNLGFYDDPPARGERWDREKFERMRNRGPGGPGGPGGRDSRESFHFDEHDRFGRDGRESRDIEFDERISRRGPRVAERERFHEDERFVERGPRRREIFDDPTPSEVANRALAPYRRKSIVERDVDIVSRRPARPQYIRRQSSLDTFDRKPMPRYGDIDREEYRPPPNMPIPLPIRERRRSPERRRFYDDDFEEVRYRDVEREREPRGEYRDEYREVEVKREKSTRRRSKSRARSVAAKSVRSSSSSSFEEVTLSRSNVGKKGKTRMPKRLVKKEAIIELGYPYEEEDDFYVIKRALEKEHIDEVIKVSENYKEEKTTYVYEDKTEVGEHASLPPPPPPPQFFDAPPPPPPGMYAPPPPPPASVAPSHHSHHAPPPPPSHYAQSVRSASPPRHEVFEERIEESNHIGGPLTVLVPEERRVVRTEREVIRSERDIKDEIRALEAERRMLKYEREGDYEIIERREPRREVVRIEKDRKVRERPNPKLVAAMMSTLT